MMNRNLGFLAGVMALAVLAAACTQTTPTSTPSPTPTRTSASAAMGRGMVGTDDTHRFAPLVMGFYGGGEVQFTHTEASDPQVASLLTMMLGPQVVLVPSLAQVPEPLLADVYVFTNGVQGAGPFGFQPDVFDSVPGDGEYSPLRQVNLVAWREGATPRELRSVEEVRSAESAGDVMIELPGVVVNMPILAWPGGQR